MLDGIQIKPLKRKYDERGFFLELMRKDWKELFKEDNIVQANLNALERNNANHRAMNIGTGKHFAA